MASPVLELTFRRASVHLVHDVKCLEDGADLNDALLDFFVKLGQALIPEGGLNGRKPPVAYLGSHFYTTLIKGGATDGNAGHANVANWATRRLGAGGLFADDVGALAVPVNETLRDDKGEDMGKHWWLALLLNLSSPRSSPVPNGSDAEDSNVLLFLDSYSRADITFDPPRRANLQNRGEAASAAYVAEVRSLSRAGCHALVRLRAQGDGSAGPLGEPRGSVMRVGDRDFRSPTAELTADSMGGDGQPGMVDGYLHFELDSEANVSGEHTLEYAGMGLFGPPLRLRMTRTITNFQRQVARFLRGYLHKEWALRAGQEAPPPEDEDAHEQATRLPDVPQQETANDCGYFILEHIFQVLQLAPKTLKWLSRASVEDMSSLPWPSQEEVTRRKDKLREGLGAMFEAAQRYRVSDVEVLLKKDADLRETLHNTFHDNEAFAEAALRLEARSQDGQAACAEASDHGVAASEADAASTIAEPPAFTAPASLAPAAVASLAMSCANSAQVAAAMSPGLAAAGAASALSAATAAAVSADAATGAAKGSTAAGPAGAASVLMPSSLPAPAALHNAEASPEAARPQGAETNPKRRRHGASGGKTSPKVKDELPRQRTLKTPAEGRAVGGPRSV